MVNAEVYKEKEKPPEKFYFKIIQDGNEIKVILVDEWGGELDGGYLITFNLTTGTIIRHPFVEERFGFQLDNTGRIKFNE